MINVRRSRRAGVWSLPDALATARTLHPSRLASVATSAKSWAREQRRPTRKDAQTSDLGPAWLMAAANPLVAEFFCPRQEISVHRRGCR